MYDESLCFLLSCRLPQPGVLQHIDHRHQESLSGLESHVSPLLVVVSVEDYTSRKLLFAHSFTNDLYRSTRRWHKTHGLLFAYSLEALS